LIDTSRYDAFGEKEGGTGSLDNKYLFTGEQYDSNLGDYYLRARYYDTDSGRFTRRDSYEGEISNPLTLHKYLYAHGNPASFTDPSGLLVLDFVAASALDNSIEVQQTSMATAALHAFVTVSSSTITLITAIARAYANAQAVATSLSRMFRIPMLVTGWEMPSTTEHITRALLSSGYTKQNSSGSLFGSPQLSPVLSHVQEGTNGRDWYQNLPIAKNLPAGTSVDEYPYASTAQGGEKNYNNNLVSLKAVPIVEQNRQGGIMSNFYRWGQVGDGGLDDVSSWYLNFAHFGSMSYMLDRSGNKRFFSYGA
jgi:RHS repeat-associated protein